KGVLGLFIAAAFRFDDGSGHERCILAVLAQLLYGKINFCALGGVEQMNTEHQSLKVIQTHFKSPAVILMSSPIILPILLIITSSLLSSFSSFIKSSGMDGSSSMEAIPFDALSLRKTCFRRRAWL
ncbi:hypothetical protein ADUPG1_001184, partial [Aduncisulcus paluster]